RRQVTNAPAIVPDDAEPTRDEPLCEIAEETITRRARATEGNVAVEQASTGDHNYRRFVPPLIGMRSHAVGTCAVSRLNAKLSLACLRCRSRRQRGDHLEDCFQRHRPQQSLRGGERRKYVPSLLTERRSNETHVQTGSEPPGSQTPTRLSCI